MPVRGPGEPAAPGGAAVRRAHGRAVGFLGRLRVVMAELRYVPGVGRAVIREQYLYMPSALQDV
ncbi:hypothetical protein GCM10010508_24750 [Streptomyces naganishii JCM 4654]|uniref:Uncharacterized protein n=1 Tax=Streptomyces naganishii JCM 4654 TaxID=1306179 RepID=A0A919CWG7_9ACTN|nr:hypothetical protein GCM10010508_24750 [Streptomyces naganishii JCM 4654]